MFQLYGFNNFNKKIRIIYDYENFGMACFEKVFI